MPTEKDWFCRQVRCYQDSLYRLAMSILQNEYDAQDSVQETLLKAYNHLDALKQKEKFKSWLFRILTNTAYEILRSKRNCSDINELETLPQPETIDLSTHITLWNAVQALPTGYRTVIILFYYEDLTIKQISQIMNVTQSTVKKRLSRAREYLKSVLKEDLRNA